MEKPGATRIFRHTSLPFLEIKTGAGPSYAVRSHSHDTLSVGFLEKGSSKIICHPQAFNLVADQAILIPPDTVHLCRPENPDRFIFRMIYVSPAWFKAAFDLNPGALHAQTRRLSREDLSQKNRLFRVLASARDRMAAESQAVIFLAHLVFSVFSLAPRPEPGPEAREEMERVKTFLDEHFTGEIQLDDLEALTGMSKFSILRRFKKHWHLTPHAYVINKRILLAKKQLKNGHTVADTAAACGFFDQSHFVKTFKNFVGINPAAYKDAPG